MSKAIVLLSGGQDSTTCLFLSKMFFDDLQAVTFDYGQRHGREIDSARRIAALARVPLSIYDILALRQIAGGALTDPTQEIKEVGGLLENLPTTFVPGRNVHFLAVACSAAAKIGVHDIVSGVCQTDYSGYPDCRRAFIDSFEQMMCLALGGYVIRIHTPLMWLTKAESVRLAIRIPGCREALALTWTCYRGGATPCGDCPACKIRAKGFAEAGMSDPALLRGGDATAT